MKKLFTIILISCSLAASAQNITLTKADTAKSNTAIRTLQSQYAGLPALDTNTVAKVRNKKVLFLQDAAIPVLQSQVIALQTSVNSNVTVLQNTDKATAAQVATLMAQTTAQQAQLNTQQGLIDKLTAQVAALLAWQANMKIANQ